MRIDHTVRLGVRLLLASCLLVLPRVASAQTLGEQRTLVTLVNFANDPRAPYTTGEIDAEILDETNPASAASYVLEVSYGLAWLSGSVQGWLSASYDDASCLVRTDSGTQRLVDELDPLIDFSTVDRWIIVIPNNPSCGFAGYSTLGKATFASAEGSVQLSRIILNGPATANVAALTAHELGHSFAGLQHSADYECGADTIGTSCTQTGTDRYDRMGSSGSGGHFTPPCKQALGWLGTGSVDVPPAGGTFLLEPYETVGTGTKVLRIPVQRTIDDYREADHYYVSYRKPLGFDAGFPELATDGAMLHLGTHYFPEFTSAALGASLLLDAKPGGGAQVADSADVLLEAGQTFTDALHGVHIQTLGMVGDQLEVQVTIDQYCGNGVRDPAVGEACDGADLGGATCASQGFTSGALACSSACGFDTSACGPAQCAPGDTFDDASGLCTASFLSVAPVDMGLYRNASTWAYARELTTATLLTASRGFLGAAQNFSGTDRSILWRMVLPFDTSALPDGTAIDSAVLRLRYDAFGAPYQNTHPDSADQLVLVQTDDPEPAVRDRSDYGAFPPIDAPPEGAPRIDVSDTYAPQGDIELVLNATGLSWIDDAGVTRLGLRTAFDVDDVTFAAPEELSFKINLVPPDSPIAGPRLEVRYQPVAVPEPGTVVGLLAGAGVLAGLARRRGAGVADRPRWGPRADWLGSPRWPAARRPSSPHGSSKFSS